MPYYTVLQYTPLLTATIFLSLVIYQVARDRFRTWTEVFFLAAWFFGGMYAVTDFLFFTARTVAHAEFAALAGFSLLTFAIAFFMLFGVVYYTRMRRYLLLAFLPPLGLLPFLWANLVVGLQPLDPAAGPPPYIGVWNSFWFTVWAVFVLAYGSVGSWAFYKTYGVVKLHTTKLKRRMQGILIALVLSVLLGGSTNVLRGMLGTPILPLFSTTLAIPGAVSWVALSPLSKERLSIAVRHWKARHYQIKMGFVIFTDGTLIGAEVEPGEKVIDQDLFSATLDVIQNFMRTSFPTLRGQWLRTITHGDYTLVIERGKRIYLVLVIQGQENDQLRRQMRDALLKYEAQNREILANWRGMPSEAKSTSAMLMSLLED